MDISTKIVLTAMVIFPLSTAFIKLIDSEDMPDWLMILTVLIWLFSLLTFPAWALWVIWS